MQLPIRKWLEEDEQLHEETLRTRILEQIEQGYHQKCEQVGTEMRTIEKQIMLQLLDNLWKEHLATMDHLRQGIHLRAYAQKNPKQEYKREAFELFEQMLNNLKHEVIRFLSKVQIQMHDAEELERQRLEAQRRAQVEFQHDEISAISEQQEQATAAGSNPSAGNHELREENSQPFVREGKKVGRNEPCPCGSGKKFKQCHGRLA